MLRTLENACNSENSLRSVAGLRNKVGHLMKFPISEINSLKMNNNE